MHTDTRTKTQSRRQSNARTATPRATMASTASDTPAEAKKPRVDEADAATAAKAASAVSTGTALVKAAEAFAREELAGMDGSHSFDHVERVRATAVRLAAEEGLAPADVELVELAALLHDVRDAKYSGSEEAGPAAAREFLLGQAYAPPLAERVAWIIANVSFRKELKSREREGTTSGSGSAGEGAGGGSDGPGSDATAQLQLAVVQDADRLDAIGAIGIARCFTFGGAKKRPLWDPELDPEVLTHATYSSERTNNSSLNHFYEKLFLLKDWLKTDSGRRTGERRHEVMKQFVDTFKDEWMGRA